MNIFGGIIFMALPVLVWSTFSSKQKDRQFHVSYQEPVNDTIIKWKKNIKLTWNDFQGEPDNLSNYMAMTYVQIGLNSRETSEAIIIDIPCFFIKTMAWTKERTPKLLKHEQQHFNIAELIARKIRMEYLKYELHTITDDTYRNLKSIYSTNYHNRLDSLNSVYDFETAHGTIESKQKEWELKIASELKELDKYSDNRVVIKRIKK